MDIVEECALLGASLLGAQKVEFALYGVVAHLSHLPEAQKEKRFRELTPEKFLRGSTDELKATLGQLEKVFGEKLLLSTRDLKGFINDRNLIAHNYWRLTKSNISGAEKLHDPHTFLKNFVSKCDHWQKILNGLVYVFQNETAKKQGRENEVKLSDIQKRDVESYYLHVAKTFNK